MYALFFLTPMFMGAWYSFTDWSGINSNYQWVGLRNYAKCFQDSRFLQSSSFTLRYTLLYVVLNNGLALLVTVLLARTTRRNTFLRGVFFTPNVLNIATVGFIWQFVLGTLNTGLFKETGWSLFGVSWLNDKRMVLYTVTLVRTWVSLGYIMVIYLAGMQAADRSVTEAAIADGADGMKLFAHITLPLIAPAITSSIFISLISGLKIFPLLMTLTGGGPGYYSESVSLNIYREGFETYRFGYASAKAMLYTLLIFLITGVQLMISKRKEADLT